MPRPLRITIDTFRGIHTTPQKARVDLEPGAAPFNGLSGMHDVFVQRDGRAVLARDGDVAFAAGATLLNVEQLFPCTALDRLVGAGDGGGQRVSLFTPGAVETSFGGFTGAPWSFAEAPAQGGTGPLYGVNGTNMAQFSAAATGTWTVTAGTIPLGAKFIVYHGNRMFCAGMTAYAGSVDPTSTVVASDPGNPRAFNIATGAAWAAEYGPLDGEPITGLGAYGPFLLVFKASKLWQVYDLDSGANRQIEGGIGASCNNWLKTPYGLAFISASRGIVLTDGNKLTPISDDVLDRHIGYGGMQGRMAFFNDRLFWHDLAFLWAYDFKLKVWTILTTMSTNGALATWHDPLFVSKPALYHGRFGGGGNIDQLLVPGSAFYLSGSNGPPMWVSGGLPPGDGRMYRVKSVRAFGWSAGNGSQRMRLLHADGASYLDLATTFSTGSSGADAQQTVIRHAGVTRQLQVEVKLLINANSALAAVELELIPRNR